MPKTPEQQKKDSARQAVRRAVRNGIVKRVLTCEKCGAAKPQKHHHDYEKPLDVHWLCAKCHAAVHVKEGWWKTRIPTFDFTHIPVGAFAVVKNATVTKISGLIYHHVKIHGGRYKSFAFGKHVVVFCAEQPKRRKFYPVPARHS